MKNKCLSKVDNYKFVPMSLEYAKIMSKWKYSGYVESIYVEPYFDNYNEKTNETKGPSGCLGYAVIKDDMLFGLFEYYFKDNLIEIGLAISPEYTNNGFGKNFVEAGIEFAINEFKVEDCILLNVNKKNIPAVRVYEKCGFIVTSESDTDLEMKKYI